MERAAGDGRRAQSVDVSRATTMPTRADLERRRAELAARRSELARLQAGASRRAEPRVPAAHAAAERPAQRPAEHSVERAEPAAKLEIRSVAARVDVEPTPGLGVRAARTDDDWRAVFGTVDEVDEEARDAGDPRDTDTAGGTDDAGLRQVAAAALEDERWTRGRRAHALAWHAGQPHVALCALGAADGARGVTQPDGVVAVWDVERGRLTRALTNTAPVHALATHTLSPALVLGGTAYGGLVAWDTRAWASYPAMSSRTRDGVPIASLSAADTLSPLVVAANVAGVLTTWSLQRGLDEPVDTVAVRDSGIRGIFVNAIAVPANASFHAADPKHVLGKRAAVLAGGTDGGLYRGDHSDDRWQFHTALARHDCPISALSCHPGSRRLPMLADLVLSTSYDWTTRLWSFDRRGVGLALQSFPSPTMDATTDVQWSPAHPGVFAVADAGASVSVYDASRDGGRHLLGHRALAARSGNATAPPAMSRLAWNKTGSILAAGDTAGALHLWTALGDIRNPSDAAWDALAGNIHRWKADALRAVPNTEYIPTSPANVMYGVPEIQNVLYKPH